MKRSDIIDNDTKRKIELILVLITPIMFFFFNTGDETNCGRYETPEWSSDICEPGSIDEIGHDFLDVTGISANTSGTIGIVLFLFWFYWLIRLGRDEEYHPHSYFFKHSKPEQTDPKSEDSEPESEPEAEANPNWWEDQPE